MKIAEITAPVPLPVIELLGVEITLSKDEAIILQQVLYCVGGYPEGPRGSMQDLEELLRDTLGDPEDYEDRFEVSGNLRIDFILE
jgi:hypothetical protein